MAANDADFTQPGPYVFEVLKRGEVFPTKDGKWFRRLGFTITVPKQPANEGNAVQRFPAVFFYSGFALAASYYSDYAQHLASWGYIVVQYDVRPAWFNVTWWLTEKAEIDFFPAVVEYIKDQLEESDSAKIDSEAIGVAGHSHGAKLAALLAVDHPSIVKALFLVDPVDGDGVHDKPGPEHPSAIAALAGKNLKFSIAAATITCECNPAHYNYPEFWKSAANESWLSAIAETGHMQFTNANRRMFGLFVKILCKGGSSTYKSVLGRTCPTMTAWFQETLLGNIRNKNAENAMSLAGFFRWKKSEVEKKEITFEIKGQPTAT